MLAYAVRPSGKTSAPSASPCGCRSGSPCGCKHEAREGRVLPEQTQARMSAHFGRSFANVRIHADERADAAASSRRSLAFTDGEHVFFAPGSISR
ncbi:MAG: hypothetical protein JWM87_227 [Candidatus Eremiobacteraeota bacterium]|nr:hypothetical protein [Candidatus Eremiobacteraeota bacterium]